MGEYVEELPFGGKLKVQKARWEIEYYCSGPDLRYNGVFKRIAAEDVDAYIQAFQLAWSEYRRLQLSLPEGGEFAKTTAEGLHIRVGGNWPGVSLFSYMKMIDSDAALDAIVNALARANERAALIQAALMTL